MWEKEQNVGGYLFTIKTLVEYDADRPDVDFGGDFRRLFTDNKTLWRQVPAVTVNILNSLCYFSLCLKFPKLKSVQE